MTTSGRMLTSQHADAEESQWYIQALPEFRMLQSIRVPRLLFSSFKTIMKFLHGYYAIIEPEFHMGMCFGRYMGMLPAFDDIDDNVDAARHLPSCGFSQKQKEQGQLLHLLNKLPFLSDEEVVAINQIKSGFKMHMDAFFDLVPGVPKMKSMVSLLDEIFCAVYAKFSRNELLKCSAYYVSQRFWRWIDS